MSGGKLIMFDGPDGVGKTTQFELAAEALRQRGLSVYTTHLLGGTEIGEALRAVMFSDAKRPPLTNLHLALAIYYALAAELQQKRSDGTVILIDRSPLSLIAYQVYGDGLDGARGNDACAQSLAAFQPDAIIVYDASLDTLQSRRSDRHKASDYFEQQAADYHKRTREGYAAAAQTYQATLLDANGSVEAMHGATMQALNQLIG